MFQTEPIHALQSFASDGMTAFMLAVTTLGYAWMLIPILLVIAFGVDFRRGFVLVHVVVWTGLLTGVLKNAFALPRPEAVDSTLLQPGDDYPESTPFVRGGAPGFWDGLPTDVVAWYRGQGDVSFGMPSGHCSMTTALWGSTAALFRDARVWTLAATLILLMPLSRMYLARHFLADVLGGIGVGLAVVGIAWTLAIRPLGSPGRPSPLARIALEPSLLRALLYLGTPLLALLLPGADAGIVVRIFGIQAGIWLLTRYGLPEGGGSVKVRAARVLMAFALYGISDRLLTASLEYAFGESDALEMAIQGFSSFVLVWGGTMLCYRTGLYRRGEPNRGLLER